MQGHFRPITEDLDASLLFVETQSPKVLSLARGTYDIVVRAYDKAGNFREVQERIRSLSPFIFYATNVYVLILLALLVVAFAFVARKIYLRHLQIENRRLIKEFPLGIREKLRELEKYKNKYGHLVILLALFLNLLFAFVPAALAQISQLGPPFISTFPRQISNEEIFYLGGRTEAPDMEIIIYVQNLSSGETFSYSETSDKNGEWFYRHPSFLSSGEYIVWTQSQLGDAVSPPSPQITLRVNPTALQFGSSRISYETLFAGLATILLMALIGLAAFTLVWSKRAKHLRKELIREIHEAEEAVRRGFEELRRDIEVELALIKRVKLQKSLSREEKEKEEHLLRDLAEIERHISKEVEDIEKTI
ncbi:MAG: hypothetical protein G01um101430_193 [Parcubacteria group bacterium Gr01-1014_30]|nr:MAG: hypothetical protein G01um101430_193 [Parcubacteria group bacterium Gr01-1014_30]